jgi:RHS repeat-associated protein
MADAEHRSRIRVDALGRVVEQRTADETTRGFAYARLGHVSDVAVSTADGALDNAVIASGIRINAREQRTQLRLANGVETSYEYEAATFRLARLHTHRVVGAARDYLDIEYTYDPVGNVTHWIDRVQDPGAPVPLLQGLAVSAACEFTYDPFYQLKQATGRVHQALLQHDYRSGIEGANPIKGTRHLTLDNGAAIERYTRNYDYDLCGNIRSIQHQGTTQNWTTEIWTSATSNRSLAKQDLNGADIADLDARFDANGNVVALPHLRAMNWNYARRLSRAVIIDRSADGLPDDAEYYVYGADGRRIRRIAEKLVDGQLEITETTYFDGCEIRRITFGGQTRLLRRSAHVTDGSARLATLHQWSVDQTARETDDVAVKKLHYLVGNHLGSVSLELDAAGDVISYEEYFPFGGTSFVAGPQARDVKLKEYRYSGKNRDDATGLYCYEYRYYAPFIGNWISPDPLGPVRRVQPVPVRTQQPDPVRRCAGTRPPPWRPSVVKTRRRAPSSRSSGGHSPRHRSRHRNSRRGRRRHRRRRVADRDVRTRADADARVRVPRTPPPDAPRPAVPPSDTGGGQSDTPTPMPPPPSGTEGTADPQPHFSECECIWVEAGYTTDWETLIREGREVQVWVQGHYECTGPPGCREGRRQRQSARSARDERRRRRIRRTRSHGKRRRRWRRGSRRRLAFARRRQHERAGGRQRR